MDGQLSQMCDLARARNIQIYSIALQAPARGQAALSGCATMTPKYYRSVTIPGDLSDVFQGIAVEITALRLFR